MYSFNNCTVSSKNAVSNNRTFSSKFIRYSSHTISNKYTVSSKHAAYTGAYPAFFVVRGRVGVGGGRESVAVKVQTSRGFGGILPRESLRNLGLP